MPPALAGEGLEVTVRQESRDPAHGAMGITFGIGAEILVVHHLQPFPKGSWIPGILIHTGSRAATRGPARTRDA